MDAETKKSAQHEAMTHALRELGDNIATQNILLAYLGLITTIILLTSLYYAIKLDALNAVTHILRIL